LWWLHNLFALVLHLIAKRYEYLLIHILHNATNRLFIEFCFFNKRLSERIWVLNTHQKQHYLSF